MSVYNLETISTLPPENLNKIDIKKQTKHLIKELDDLQYLLFAEHKRSVLIILQGMDASGKDGAVRKAFSSVNPQGVKVISFKAPTEEELDHDFLWRIHQHTPAKGMIQIFNRSHYEDVLITRVNDIIDDITAQKHFNYINSFEQMLQDKGTGILKFYLHISEEEQHKRFKERVQIRRKFWKYSPDDHETARYWPAYRKVYQDVFENCSPNIPWMIVPSDKNWYKEYIITKTLVDTLKNFDMQFPDLQN